MEKTSILRKEIIHFTVELVDDGVLAENGERIRQRQANELRVEASL